MRNLLASCTLLFGAAALAQTSGTNTVLIAPPVGQNCPISLTAQHTPGGSVVNVGKQESPGKQGYRLTLASSPLAKAQNRVIVGATVTLHGISGQHLLPASEKDGDDAAESVAISLIPGSDHRFHSTVYTERLNAVQWIELNTLTYADGSQWRESASASCRVTPNGYMPVAEGNR